MCCFESSKEEMKKEADRGGAHETMPLLGKEKDSNRDEC